MSTKIKKVRKYMGEDIDSIAMRFRYLLEAEVNEPVEVYFDDHDSFMGMDHWRIHFRYSGYTMAHAGMVEQLVYGDGMERIVRRIGDEFRHRMITDKKVRYQRADQMFYEQKSQLNRDEAQVMMQAVSSEIKTKVAETLANIPQKKEDYRDILQKQVNVWLN